LFDSAAGGLSGNWTVNYSGLGAGTVGQDGRGNCWWNGFGGIERTARCRWNAGATATDDQVIATVMPLRVQDPLLGGDSYLRLLARMNTSGNTFVYGEISNNTASIGCFVAGTQTTFQTVSTATSNGDSWVFYAGAGGDPYRFQLKRNGIVIVDFTDDTSGSHVSQRGSSYRSVGFEMRAANRLLLLAQTSPGTMAVFSADDL
jgi:hypothetical protein